jgi:hypothetical protein
MPAFAGMTGLHMGLTDLHMGMTGLRMGPIRAT